MCNYKAQSLIEYMLILAAILVGLIVAAGRVGSGVQSGISNAKTVVGEMVANDF